MFRTVYQVDQSKVSPRKSFPNKPEKRKDLCFKARVTRTPVKDVQFRKTIKLDKARSLRIVARVFAMKTSRIEDRTRESKVHEYVSQYGTRASPICVCISFYFFRTTLCTLKRLLDRKPGPSFTLNPMKRTDLPSLSLSATLSYPFTRAFSLFLSHSRKQQKAEQRFVRGCACACVCSFAYVCIRVYVCIFTVPRY